MHITPDTKFYKPRISGKRVKVVIYKELIQTEIKSVVCNFNLYKYMNGHECLDSLFFISELQFMTILYTNNKKVIDTICFM